VAFVVGFGSVAEALETGQAQAHRVVLEVARNDAGSPREVQARLVVSRKGVLVAIRD